MEQDLLESVVEAAKLQGQIQYNRERTPGNLHARVELIKEYDDNYRSVLEKHGDNPVVNTIIEFFDVQRKHQFEHSI